MKFENWPNPAEEGDVMEIIKTESQAKFIVGSSHRLKDHTEGYDDNKVYVTTEGLKLVSIIKTALKWQRKMTRKK